MLATNPYLLLVLFSLWPAIAISRRRATPWQSGVAFAASYPTIVFVVGSVMTATLLYLAPLGFIDFD
jgi:hypothetical protein